jgi:hypothetical protein
MTPIDGLDVYTTAPAAVERPAWVVMEGNEWARVDGECRPVLVDDASAGRLEITTCVDGATTCGVVVTATDTLVAQHTWCRAGRDEVTGPLEPRSWLLVSADEQKATYTRAVQLWIAPIRPWSETQPCSTASLRTMRIDARNAGEKQPEFDEDRTCSGAEGFQAREMPRPPDASPHPELRASNDRVDCRVPCPPGLNEQQADADAQVRDKWFLPKDAPSFAFYRTADACRAATGTAPSGLPADVCTTLGAKLP